MNPSPPTLVAVDTNVLLDCACGDEPVLDALATMRRRIQGVRFIVPPTALQELAHWARKSEDPEKQRAASTALRSLRSEWGFQPLNLVPVGHGIVQRIAQKLQASGSLPVEEHNDALILAEAALLGCTILLTGDGHLRGLDYQKAALELKASDVEMPVIATPREIVAKFF